MSVVLLGVNHHTAPVALRERLALSGCALRTALEELRATELFSEAVLLSTCNRLELYAVLRPQVHHASVVAAFSALYRLPESELVPHLSLKTGETVTTHLLRVACGLESMILGEDQILGQVGLAFQEAQTAGSVGPVLSRLFAQATQAGKRARTETEISRFTTSVSHAGAQLVLQTAPRRVLVVGVGEMAVLAAQTLRATESVELAVINRTLVHAEDLAQKLSARALSWCQLEEALTWADAVICATGAPHTVIYYSEVAAAVRARESRPLTLVDIAVPRDIEETVATLESVAYHDIDALQQVIDANFELRRAAVPAVEQIIGQETARFTEWLQTREVTPVIKDLRDWAQGLAQSEVEKALARLPHADEATQRAIEILAHSLVNRLMHEPTLRLRSNAIEGNGVNYADTVRDVFGLEAARCPFAEKN
ncbi:glutamyl-tRNA reductase [Armatimonas rosea]|uniref:Glutamyl-tRNA reductase n=1 Tax=Armatimonas rosea TaxID=685828 RepID=A0A7W9SRE8_ARMRO|nr:glutamyl-tRNA reductase [Armatimonas rosea]